MFSIDGTDPSDEHKVINITLTMAYPLMVSCLRHYPDNELIHYAMRELLDMGELKGHVKLIGDSEHTITSIQLN